MEPINDPALVFARSLSDWGIWFVILGVAGEVGAALTDFISEKQANLWHEKWKSALKIGEIISGAILVLGLVLEYDGHKREVRILDAYNAQSFREAKSAEDRAAQANERAANAEKGAQVSRVKADELERQMAETKTAMTNLDRTKPINSISAGCTVVALANASQQLFPPEYIKTGNSIGELSFFNSTNNNKYKLVLSAQAIEPDRSVDMHLGYWIAQISCQFQDAEQIKTNLYGSPFVDKISENQFYSRHVLAGSMDDFDSASLILFIKPFRGHFGPFGQLPAGCMVYLIFNNGVCKQFPMASVKESESSTVFSGQLK